MIMILLIKIDHQGNQHFGFTLKGRRQGTWLTILLIAVLEIVDCHRIVIWIC